MSDQLSDTQIALLCDIGQASRYSPPADKTEDVERLMQGGFVAVVDDHATPTFQLTEKASTFLSARGATLNEA